MRRRRQNCKGQALIETALVLPLTIALILFVLWIGEAQIRELTTTQVARDAASMYARGTDFSPAALSPDDATVNIVLPKLASSVGTLYSGSHSPAGTGVLIFSSLTFLGKSTCPNGAGTGTGQCVNYGKYVFTQQFNVGNGCTGSPCTGGLRKSNFGTATDTQSAKQYLVDPVNYKGGAGNVASSFALNPAPIVGTGQAGYQSGQPIYIVEAFFTGLGPLSSSLGVTYGYAVF